MPIELPVLRLGLAGFSAQQKAELDTMLQHTAVGRHEWKTGRFADADAWWINGSRIQLLANGIVRVPPGIPSERALHLNLQEVDRPAGFSLPMASGPFKPMYTFEAGSLPSINEVLQKFEGWLQPVAAQFSLAARILDQESVLGTGVYHVSVNGQLLAVVNMQGEIGVIPSAGPAAFDNAVWSRRAPSSTAIPERFVRTSLSQIMWQYALRTSRDVLPARYRTGVLYFRRPPRLPQRLLTDSHLLLIRELASGPASFEGLQQRTGLGATQLARDLAALYFVGSITVNPRRASVKRPLRANDETEASQGLQHSEAPSGLDADASPVSRALPRQDTHDLTVPMPIGPE
jgi:hypothetical protein